MINVEIDELTIPIDNIANNNISLIESRLTLLLNFEKKLVALFQYLE